MNEMKTAFLESLIQYGYEESFRSLNLVPSQLRNDMVAFLVVSATMVDFCKKFKPINTGGK